MKKILSLLMSALAVVAVVALVFTPLGCPGVAAPMGPLGVVISDTTQTTTTITWRTTDVEASSQVEYGETTAYGLTTTLDETLVTSHSVTVTGLSPGTTYHFRVKSVDAADNLIASSDYTFAMLPLETLNFGLIMPLTGSQAGKDEDARIALNYLFSEINEGTYDMTLGGASLVVEPGGGLKIGDTVYKLNLMIEDGTSEAAYSSTTKLYYEDGCLLVWGPPSSPGTIASQPILEGEGMVSIGTARTYDATMEYLGEPVKCMFRAGMVAEYTMKDRYDVISEMYPDLTKVGIWYQLGSEAATNWKNLATDYADDVGWEIVYTETFPEGCGSFSALIAESQAAGVEILDLNVGFHNDVCMAIKDIHTAGWDVLRVGGAIITSIARIDDIVNATQREGWIVRMWPEDPVARAAALGTIDYGKWEDQVMGLHELWKDDPSVLDVYNPKGPINVYMCAQAMLTAAQEYGKVDQSLETAQGISEIFRDMTICNYYGPATFGGLERYGGKHTLNTTHAYSQFKADGTLEFIYTGECVIP